MTALLPRYGELTPEYELRQLWTAQGVPAAKQDALIAAISAKAAPGAQVGPFTLPCSEEATPVGMQFVIPGCERDQKRGPKQMRLF